jgi:hypothetical protein
MLRVEFVIVILELYQIGGKVEHLLGGMARKSCG